MATLYIIDQSFRDEGSHHADYIHCVAKAAVEAGYKVMIGANRRLPLRSVNGLKNPDHVDSIRRSFKNTTYQKCSQLAGLQRMKRLRLKLHQKPADPQSKSGFALGRTSKFRVSLAGLIDKLQAYRLRKDQDAIIRQFAKDCSSFFQPATFSSSDHIFFASISDLELSGLASYLARTPQTLRAQWHVQFHFNLLDGRPPEYEQQSAILQTVRSRLTAALAPVVYHNLSFYCTTNELTEQYNQLGIGHFQTLAYPIATEFAPHGSLAASRNRPVSTPLRFKVDTISQQTAATVLASAPHKSATNWTGSYSEMTGDERNELLPDSNACPVGSNDSLNGSVSERSQFQRPLQVVCPGAIRREKGQGEYLPALIQEIESSLLANRKIQLIIQQSEKKIAERTKLSLPKVAHADDEAISVCPHPLPRAEYVQLIRQADIGLLYYDSQAYYSRRAGILGELLSVGKPVVVPAGCWLAEQVAEPIFRHAEKWFAEHEHRRLGLADLRWEISNAPMHGGIVNFDNARRPFRFESEICPADSVVGLRFDWHWPSESGIYCRAEWEQLDEDGLIIERGCQVLGHRSQQNRNQLPRKTIALIPIRSGASRIKFCLKNAFHHSSASLRNLELLIANSEQAGTAAIPLGAVGVIVPDRESLAASLLEIVTHFEHYRDSANKFSLEWFEQHYPAKTFAQLTAPDQLATEVA